MQKLDEMLKENPKNPDALVFQGFGKVLLASSLSPKLMNAAGLGFPIRQPPSTSIANRP